MLAFCRITCMLLASEGCGKIFFKILMLIEIGEKETEHHPVSFYLSKWQFLELTQFVILLSLQYGCMLLPSMCLRSVSRYAHA